MTRDRRSEAAHGLCEEHDVLDIRTLVAAGALGRGTHSVRLPGVLARLEVRTVEVDAAIYIGFVGGDRTFIELAWTPCNFGGRRPWLRCPGACRGRCRKLYWTGHTWRCRECADLRYESQGQRALKRGFVRAGRIREQLGGDPSMAAPFPPRPKWMRVARYEQLRDQVLAAELAYAKHLTASAASEVEALSRRLRAMESAPQRKPYAVSR